MSLKDRTDSVWEKFNLPHFPTLSHNLQAEVCVVGGGITGLAIAYELAKRGHDVTVLEAMRLGSGQTGRSTGHLSSQLEEDFQKLLKMHDASKINTFWNAHRSAIAIFEHIITQENISCDFKKIPGYLFLGKNEKDDFLGKERDAAQKCGVELEMSARTPLLNSEIPSLIFSDQAQFHPLKFLRGLCQVLKDLGVKIFENTHVRHFENVNGKSMVTTSEGCKVESKFLVVATNTPINNRLYMHTKQAPYRSYVMSFDLKDTTLPDCLLWDTEDPYHYIRFGEGKLIVGGEDHKTGQDPKNGNPFVALEIWARDHFDFLGDVCEKWSGQVFEPVDQMGFIGRNPGLEDNVFISTGESGIGLTSAMIASQLIPDLIEKKENAWEKVFDPGRISLGGMTDFLKENTNVAMQYVDWVTPGEVKDIDLIPVDSGSLVREGLQKNCVYHDEHDHFEKHCATCPHLGGVVKWNDIEKTWDCPLHGSRFSTKGEVIEGPAVGNLAGPQ
jgi:glycine/D-amino acid oxidase-like deaminating enzyme/nitrite reductase/ring-hydroxylating ferredoxin subunit